MLATPFRVGRKARPVVTYLDTEIIELPICRDPDLSSFHAP